MFATCLLSFFILHAPGPSDPWMSSVCVPETVAIAYWVTSSFDQLVMAEVSARHTDKGVGSRK